MPPTDTMSGGSAPVRGGPIVFVHGAGFTGAWWTPQKDALSEFYQVFTPDLPGHGRRAQEKFGMEQALAAIDALFAGTVASPALFVGISLGGYVAIEYAARHPNHVAGLALSGCSVNMNGLTGLGFILTGWLLRMRGPKWLAEANLRSFRKRVPAALSEPVIAAGFHPRPAVSAFFESSARDYHRALATYGGPVALLNGADDELSRSAEERLLLAVPHAQSFPIAGAGHLTNLEQPAAFTAAVARFADTLDW